MTKRARALAYDIATRDSFDVSCSTTRDYFTFETTSAMLGIRRTVDIPTSLVAPAFETIPLIERRSNNAENLFRLIKMNLR